MCEDSGVMTPGDFVHHRHLPVAGVVTEVRPTGTDEAWSLVEVRTGTAEDEVFCDTARNWQRD